MKQHKYNPELPFPAFFVEYGNGESDEDADMNIPPTSGQQYLRRVQLEASRCPDVVVANIDRSNFANKQTIVVSASNGCVPAPPGFTPSLKWQTEQISNFSDTRMAVSRYKARVDRTAHSNTNLPRINDDVAWCTFCFGNRLQKQLPQMNDTSVRQKPVDGSSTGALPLLSIVTSMTQPLLEQVLDYHINWFEATGFSAEQGRWFYALLACLEKPLTPEACSSLRNLARNCANLRASLGSPEDPILVQLNLLLCLVARYFDQGDLADCTT